MEKIGAPEKMKDDCDDNTLMLMCEIRVSRHTLKENAILSQDVFILSAFFTYYLLLSTTLTRMLGEV